jgi:hypothetical protein
VELENAQIPFLATKAQLVLLMRPQRPRLKFNRIARGFEVRDHLVSRLRITFCRDPKRISRRLRSSS